MDRKTGTTKHNHRDSSSRLPGQRVQRGLHLRGLVEMTCPEHGVEHWPWNEMESAITSSPYAICWAKRTLTHNSATRMLHEGRISADLYEAWLDLWKASRR